MHKYFFVLTSGFASGIFFRSFFDQGVSFSVFIILLSVFVFFSYIMGDKGEKNILFTAVFMFAAGVGMLRFDIADMQRRDPILDNAVGANVQIEGVIIDEPDERESSTRLVVAADALISSGARAGVDNRVLITAEHYPQWEYGDRVRAKGELRIPKNFITDTGREFDYVRFLEKDGIHYQMFQPSIELVGKDNGNAIKRALFSLKGLFLKSVEENIPEPHASLLGGLVVGAKQSLGKDLLDAFRSAGIIHIVVLSGYNVTIVAEALMSFFSFIPKIPRLALGTGTILGFMVMVGAGATVVRASVMAIIVIFARATGRMYEITIALLFAGFSMLALNPRILVFDPSFQLSFLATVGLIYLAPAIERYFHLIPTKWKLREFATATIATQIFVLPLLLYMTGQFSIVALPVNLLVLALIPPTMFFGFLAGIAGFASSILSLPFAIVAYFLLDYELKIVEIFSNIPFADISVPYFPVWLLAAVYAVYAILLLKMKSRKNTIDIKTQNYDTGF